MIRKKLKFWNKYNNLVILKNNWFNIPKFTLYKNDTFINYLNKPLILRSSFSLEDNSKNSFSWIFESYFPIYNLDDLRNAFKFCRSSLNSNRFKKYINVLDIDISKLKENYILQEYIVWDISWIIFTNNWRWKIRIEFIPGINFSLTDWKVIFPNTFLVDRENFENFDIESVYIDNFYYTILNFSIIKKDIEGIDLDLDYQLFFLELKNKLCTLALNIEKLFNHSQDIEFTIKWKEIFILQSRNITYIINNKKCQTNKT